MSQLGYTKQSNAGNLLEGLIALAPLSFWAACSEHLFNLLEEQKCRLQGFKSRPSNSAS